LGFATGWTKAAGGEAVVVGHGGFLDDNSFRQVIQPNSELTYTGLWSIDHPYPASQRYFKVSAAQNADSKEVINVPTKDGVLVGVEGTFYFRLSTDPAVLEDFDNTFGTRSFPSGGDSLHAWDGDEGWNAFLAATLGNLVQNALRQEIGNVTCADLVASYTLAQKCHIRRRPHRREGKPDHRRGPAGGELRICRRCAEHSRCARADQHPVRGQRHPSAGKAGDQTDRLGRTRLRRAVSAG
jgi:hypothetical protein